MSAEFLPALGVVLRHEGGFVDHPSDPGGATNFGVSLRALRQLEGSNLGIWDLDGNGIIDGGDVRLMKREQAEGFYHKHYWLSQYEQMNSQAVANKIFDIHVNAGPMIAARILQESANVLGRGISIDGNIGPKTLDAVNVAISLFSEPVFVMAIQNRQANFYLDLVTAKRSREVFLLGWLRRAFDMV